MSTAVADALTQFLASVTEYRAQAPHLRAYEELQNAAAEIDKVLGPAAADVWEEIANADPGDPLAHHHLAIIRHGTGYRLHEEKQPKEAAEAWASGLRHWARVVESDGFWARLEQTWRDRWVRSKETDSIAQRLLEVDLDSLRAQLAGRLLALHAVLAEEYARTDPDLAGLHLTAIRESGFDPGPVADARAKVYGRLVRNLAALCEEKRDQEARNQVRDYLRLDPDFPQALADGLRTCTSETDRDFRDESRTEPLRTMFAEARGWAEHPALVAAGETDGQLRTARSEFYRAWARLCFNRGIEFSNTGRLEPAYRMLEESLVQIQRAADCCEHGGPKVAELFHTICAEAGYADVQDHLDDGRFPFANRLLDAGLARDPNSPTLHAVRAYACFWARDDAGFRRALAKAEDLNQRSPAERATTHLTNLRQLARLGFDKARVQRLLNKALEAMGEKRFRAALPLLAEALRLNPRAADVALFKGLCHNNLGQDYEARNCIREAYQLMDSDTDPELRGHITRFYRQAFG